MAVKKNNVIDFDFHLHCKEHSQNGRQTMEELLERAQKANINLIALTDHNTVAGIFDIKKKASKFGITAINGTELSVSLGTDVLPDHPGIIINILGLNFKLDKQLFSDAITKGLQRKSAVLYKIARYFEKEKHIYIEKKESRIDIAKGLFYTKVFPSVEEADKYLLSPEFLAKFPYEQLYPEEAIELIHAMGGKCILSHPFRAEDGIKLTNDEVSVIINYLAKLGLDGVEIFHPENFKDDDLEVYNFLKKLTTKNKLLISLGSDRHSSHDKTEDYFSKIEAWNSTNTNFELIKKKILKVE